MALNSRPNADGRAGLRGSGRIRALLQELLLKIWQEIPVTIPFVTQDVDEAVFLLNRIMSLGHAPVSVREDISVDLPYPRDQIQTRGLDRFGAVRQPASIFLQEKAIATQPH